MTDEQLHILRHSLGLDEKGHGREYRNYYCSGSDCAGYETLMSLVQSGHMQGPYTSADTINHYFCVTEKGRNAALKDVVYPKLTRSQKRYQRFLEADMGISFGDFLKLKLA